jgi:glutathione peroxidase-family protein
MAISCVVNYNPRHFSGETTMLANASPGHRSQLIAIDFPLQQYTNQHKYNRDPIVMECFKKYHLDQYKNRTISSAVSTCCLR